MFADDEQKRRALIAATVVAMVLTFVVGVLSTGLVSAVCGIDSAEGTYCARISEEKFPIEEMCLILAPVVLAAWPGARSVRRRSARPLLVASVPLFLIALFLPLVVAVVWK